MIFFSFNQLANAYQHPANQVVNKMVRNIVPLFVNSYSLEGSRGKSRLEIALAIWFHSCSMEFIPDTPSIIFWIFPSCRVYGACHCSMNKNNCGTAKIHYCPLQNHHWSALIRNNFSCKSKSFLSAWTPLDLFPSTNTM